MTVDLTRDEIWFLKARAAGGPGRIVSAFASNAGLARLVEVQYITKQPQSERKTLAPQIDKRTSPETVVTSWAVPSHRKGSL